MSDITELAQREKFEAWAELVCALPWAYLKKRRTSDDTYSEPGYTDMWAAWKAASVRLVEAMEKAQQHENEWKSLCEAAAVDLDDWSAIDDKSRELICKLADTVIAKAEQSAEWERKAISNFEECAKLSQRITELESRTVKLPDDAEHDIMAPVAAYLSEKFKWDGRAVRWDGRNEYDALADRVKYALRMVIRRAAGIKVEAE